MSSFFMTAFNDSNDHATPPAPSRVRQVRTVSSGLETMVGAFHESDDIHVSHF
jgi:hypothetical protein